MIDANFRAISSLESMECCRKYSCTVNVAVSENIVAVTGKKVAVSIARSSCEGLPRSGNTVLRHWHFVIMVCPVPLVTD
jgi:hypothetical protein